MTILLAFAQALDTDRLRGKANVMAQGFHVAGVLLGVLHVEEDDVALDLLFASSKCNDTK